MCYGIGEEAIKEIRSGINLVFSASKFSNFGPEEMNRILSGDEHIDKAFLKSRLNFYNRVSPVVREGINRWIDEATDEQLQNFLQLVTGN